MSTSVLQRILTSKRGEVEELKRKIHPAEARRQARRMPAGRDLLSALKDCPFAPIIAEIKRASPSAGRLKESVEVHSLAQAYRSGGAAALSVLTDGPFFSGSLGDLQVARGAVDLPILRKDFIIDASQLYQSKLAGADAVLLIAAALHPSLLEELFLEALELGLSPLIEVHARKELDRVLTLNPALIGVNNRDLATLTVSLAACLELRGLIPPETLVVAESGIASPQDVARLRAGGIDAFLVGTTLMQAGDPGAAVRRLCRAGVESD